MVTIILTKNNWKFVVDMLVKSKLKFDPSDKIDRLYKNLPKRFEADLSAHSVEIDEDRKTFYVW